MSFRRSTFRVDKPCQRSNAVQSGATSACSSEGVHRLGLTRSITRLESKVVFPMAESIRPSTEAGGTTRGKRRSGEFESGEGNISRTKWAGWSLGIGRVMEGFIVVVVGKGGEHEISVSYSVATACLACSLSKMRHLGFLTFCVKLGLPARCGTVWNGGGRSKFGNERR